MKRKFLTRFVAHYESCVQDIENAILVIRVLVVVFEREKNCTATLVFFFLIIVKSLQLRRRK